MGALEAAIVVVGALLFVASAGLAILADLWHQKKEKNRVESTQLSIETGPNDDSHNYEDQDSKTGCCACCCCYRSLSASYEGHIKIRYLSFAIDATNPSYWLFTVGCVLFAPIFIFTAACQKTLAESRSQGQEYIDNLMVYAIIGAICGILMSAVPTRSTMGVVVHGVTASAFQCVGIAYGVEVTLLARVLFESDALFALRAVLLACSVGAAFASLVVICKAMAWGRIMDPNADNEKEPTPRDVRHARRWMAALAGCQIALGTSIGLIVATGGAEAALVSFNRLTF